MELAVLVEPVGGRWEARTGPPWGLSAGGATADEAVAGVRAELARRVAAGAVVTTVTVPGPNGAAAGVFNPPPPGFNPSLAVAGTLDLNDPVVQEWLAIIEQNRREMDADPNR